MDRRWDILHLVRILMLLHLVVADVEQLNMKYLPPMGNTMMMMQEGYTTPMTVSIDKQYLHELPEIVEFGENAAQYGSNSISIPLMEMPIPLAMMRPPLPPMSEIGKPILQNSLGMQYSHPLHMQSHHGDVQSRYQHKLYQFQKQYPNPPQQSMNAATMPGYRYRMLPPTTTLMQSGQKTQQVPYIYSSLPISMSINGGTSSASLSPSSDIPEIEQHRMNECLYMYAGLSPPTHVAAAAAKGYQNKSDIKANSVSLIPKNEILYRQ